MHEVKYDSHFPAYVAGFLLGGRFDEKITATRFPTHSDKKSHVGEYMASTADRSGVFFLETAVSEITRSSVEVWVITN